MGSGHATNISRGDCPEFEIVAIADKNSERLEWSKGQNFGENITYFEDAMKMLDSGLIEACIVAVPHFEHTKYAIECINRVYTLWWKNLREFILSKLEK